MPIDRLIEGFRSFRSSYFDESDHYEKLVRDGQSPETLVIACSDSRNDPALLTKSLPGDLFVIRNVAAIVPPYEPDSHYHGTSAAIEFAVKGLNVRNIIVLGHSLCGGVKTLTECRDKEHPEFEFLSRWVSIGLDARRAVDRILPGQAQFVRQRALEQALVLTSINNLRTFPWIREKTEAGTLLLHAWYFDMTEGNLLGYDKASGLFVPID